MNLNILRRLFVISAVLSAGGFLHAANAQDAHWQPAQAEFSDGKDNGGNLSFVELKKQVIEIQKRLKLELYLARNTLNMKIDSNSFGNGDKFMVPELPTVEELDLIVQSFHNEEDTSLQPNAPVTREEDASAILSAKITPTTKLLFVEALADDGIEVVKVPVDAINNSQKWEIKINLSSWSLLNECGKAQLVLHEHMGLLEIEESLNYNLSSPLIKETSFCKETR